MKKSEFAINIFKQVFVVVIFLIFFIKV